MQKMHLRKISGTLLLLLFVFSLKADEGLLLNRVWNPYLVMQRPQPQGQFGKMVIPIKRAGNLILVEARVDGILGYFILDTGAPYLVLNQTYFRNFKLERNLEVSDLNGLAGPRQVSSVQKLEIRDLYYEDVLADVFDLSAIENKRGVKILGLLGVNLWLELELEFDLKASVLGVYNLNRKGQRLMADEDGLAPAVYHFDYLMRNNVILLKSKLQEQRLMLCFDTGAETVVLNNKLKKEAYQNVEITKRKALVAAGGQGLEVLYGNLSNLNVGCPILKSQVIIANLAAIGKSYGIEIDGIIGYDLLRQGKLSINFKNKTITIKSYG